MGKDRVKHSVKVLQIGKLLVKASCVGFNYQRLKITIFGEIVGVSFLRSSMIMPIYFSWANYGEAIHKWIDLKID